MYKLTESADCVIRLEDGTRVARGTWLWEFFEQFLLGGGVPEPAVRARTLEECRQELRDASTAHRWSVETGGIELNGVRVGTRLDDQNRLSGVLSAISLGGLEAVDFKAQSGWVQLTAPELQGIALAISQHVQACFSAERAHHEAIGEIESMEAADAYDVSQGWPETGG
jgi:hypothetical protein